MLSKIFGEYPRVKILDSFLQFFDEELSIEDIIWLTDLPKTILLPCINELLKEEIISRENQYYLLNTEKIEIKLLLSVTNYYISYRLKEKLEERGLKPIEE